MGETTPSDADHIASRGGAKGKRRGLNRRHRGQEQGSKGESSTDQEVAQRISLGFLGRRQQGVPLSANDERPLSDFPQAPGQELGALV